MGYELKYFLCFVILKELRGIFSSFDNDNDGLVNAKDISALFKCLEQNFQSFVIKEDELKVLLGRNHING
jgi:hypothetical protein